MDEGVFEAPRSQRKNLPSGYAAHDVIIELGSKAHAYCTFNGASDRIVEKQKNTPTRLFVTQVAQPRGTRHSTVIRTAICLFSKKIR